MMTTNNHKHSIANRTTALAQQYVSSLGLTDVVSGLSKISSHVTPRSPTRLFMHVQSFSYSPISQSLPRLQAYMLGFQVSIFGSISNSITLVLANGK